MKIRTWIEMGCALGLVLGASACLVDVEDEIGSERRADARYAQNALTSNALTSNALTSNALTSNALTSNALADPSQGSDAAAIIEYSVRCMLRSDQSVTVAYLLPDLTPVIDTYWGSLALEPEWADWPLTAAGKRWWGACLGVHVNAFGIPVSLSLRGPHASLTITVTEAENYLIREGSFYAEYVATREPPLHIYSCRDPANVDAAYAHNRICANESCGSMFTAVGDCLGPATDACESAHAPDQIKGDFYRRCHRDLGGPEWADAAINQAITANLTPTY